MNLSKTYQVSDPLADQLFARIIRYLKVSEPLTGTTAQRPSMDSSDAGRMFFDVTLAANGKPIWWNGAAWVDSTGTIV